MRSRTGRHALSQQAAVGSRGWCSIKGGGCGVPRQAFPV
jgi:hypothetical protein